jgi:prepilin-type N-terminal cleavage/methylation domain-containing protein/prepilin-type processing-associated H-X9-DG protein
MTARKSRDRNEWRTSGLPSRLLWGATQRGDCHGGERSMSHTPRSSERRGFTLIELLVVIAIIAILAAILFPVFARARAAATAAACMSYTTQFSKAAIMYADDNGKLPRYACWPEGQHRWELWWTTLQPYLKNRDVYICPLASKLDHAGFLNDDPVYGKFYWGSVNSAWRAGGYVGSHCINGWLYGVINWDQRHSGSSQGLSMSAIREPVKTMMFSDGSWVDAWPGVSGSLVPGQDGAGVDRIYIQRHGDGINMTFADSHAKRLSRDALTNPDDAARQCIYRAYPGEVAWR